MPIILVSGNRNIVDPSPGHPLSSISGCLIDGFASKHSTFGYCHFAYLVVATYYSHSKKRQPLYTLAKQLCLVCLIFCNMDDDEAEKDWKFCHGS